MKGTAKLVGLALMGIGVMVMAIGAVNWQKAAAGLESLDAVYEAQGIELSYNEQGELVDRGQTEGAQAILSLLEDDYKFPVNHADLDASDPLVNTPTELMFQFATISYHVLHGTQTVTLDETVEYEGETFEAGTYEVPVDGRYWSDFDRMHPLDGQVREAAWSPTAHALLAELSAGTGADYQAGFAHFAAWRTIIIGFAIGLGGFGLVALATEKKEETASTSRERERVATA